MRPTPSAEPGAPTATATPPQGADAPAGARLLVVPARLVLGTVLGAVWVAAVVGRPVPVPVGAALVLALALALGDQAVAVLRLVVVGRLSRALVAVASGVTALLLALLLLDVLGPLVGLARPLSTFPVAVTVTLTGLLLHLAEPARGRWRSVVLPVPRLPALLGGAALALLPLGGAASAVALDNGRGPALGLAVVASGLVVLAALGLRRRPPPLGWFAAAIYAVALSWLLMSSLRGPSTTGHDVQTEHYAAQLAATAGRWTPSAFPSDYNACLSVTVLPVALGALLHLGVVPWFTVVAQVLFALCPVAVLVASTHLAGPRLGAAAAVLFTAFPTFVVDLSMMVRQEVAFLLVAVLVLLVVQRADDPTDEGMLRRRLAVVLVGGGVVLSHYSTSYILLVQLGLAAGVAAALAARRHLRRLPGRTPPVVTLPVVAVLAAGALAWGGGATSTGGSAVHVAGQLIGVVTGRVVDQVGSGDAAVSIFGGAPRPTPQQELDRTVADLLATAPPDQQASLRTVLTAYPLVAPAEVVQPLTAAGRALEREGVDVAAAVGGVRTTSAQVLQVLVGLGVVLALRRTLLRGRDAELALCAVGAVLVLGAFVLFPLLTAAYGLLRVFQQALLVAALPAVVVLARGLALVPTRVPDRWRRARPPLPGGAGVRTARDLPARGALLVVLLFAVSSTSLLSTLTGGYRPALALATTGDYAQSFTTDDAELAMFQWVASRPEVKARGGDAVQADLWTGIRFWSQTQVSPPLGALPVQLQDGTYVLVGTTLLRDGVAATGSPNLPAAYEYPVAALTASKDLVYDDGSAQVWR